MTTDFRREWIKQRLNKYFGLKKHHYFDEMFEENDELEDQFTAFIEDDFYHADESSKRFFYVYRTYYEKIVEEEVMVPMTARQLQEEALLRLRESPEGLEFTGESETDEEFDTQETTTDDEMNKKDGKKRKKGKKSPKEKGDKPKKAKAKGKKGGKKGKKDKKKKKKKKEENLEMEMEEEEEEEEEIFYVPRIIQKIIMESRLIGGFGLISEAVANPDNRLFVYFFRKTEVGIPNFEIKCEAFAKMPLYFVVGSCNGDMLESVSDRINHIYLKLLHSYFTEPVLNAYESDEASTKYYSSEKESKYLKSGQSVYTQKSNVESKRLRLIKLLTNTTVMSTKVVELSETPIKDELERNLNQFKTTIDWTISHVNDDIDLPMIMNLTDILNNNLTNEELLQDDDLLIKLEEIVMSWCKHIGKIVESYLMKVPDRLSPLSEYEYWRERQIGLHTIFEQIKKPMVIRVLELLELAKSPCFDSFYHYQNDLMKQYVLARDTVRFLTTILRHLKLVKENNDFVRIKSCIPLLMEGFQLIWVLSRYYCTDETMVPLMAQIIDCILEKVRKKLATDTLFRKSLNYIRKTILSAQEMLEIWYTSYMEQRKRIELSGKGARWEFDKKRLFAESNYMATVCKDLLEIVLIIEQYQQIFGPDLKSIVNDPQKVNDVNKRVDRLIIQIENVDFDIFSENCRENWQAILVVFYKEVNELDLQGCKFIDQIFHNFIHSHRAVTMLLKLKVMNTRPMILERLLYKFETVFDQLNKEVLSIEDMFMRNKRHPPLCRNHPPHGGAIYWAQMCHLTLKISVVLFDKIPELKDSKRRQDCFRNYYELGEKIRKYTELKYQEFIKIYEPMAENVVKNNLLKLATGNFIKQISDPKQKHKRAGSTLMGSQTLLVRSQQSLRPSSMSTTSVSSITKRKSMGASNKLQQQQQQSSTQQLTWQEIIGDQLLMESNLEFAINFNFEIFNGIRGAELLDTIGLEFSEKLVSVTIKKERLQEDVYTVKEMIEKYNEFLKKLTPAQDSKNALYLLS